MPILPQRGSTVGSSTVGRQRVDHVARADLRPEVLRVVRMAGVLHRVEVIEVAEELVEAVHRRQELVLVAEVVLAELAGGVAHALEGGRDGGGLGRQAGRRAGLADGRHAGADRQLAGDEVGAPRRAACLGIVVGEQHALGGDLVEIRRAARHHAAVVGADVPDADVVAHDDDDVRPLRLRLSRCRRADWSRQRERHQRRCAQQGGARSRASTCAERFESARRNTV